MYPSDITDKEWSILAPFVVQGKMGRPRKHEIQKIINGIRYVMKSGCQWRLSPKPKLVRNGLKFRNFVKNKSANP